MTKRILAVATAATFMLAACGGGGGGAQDEVADMTIDAMKSLADEFEIEIDIDEGCIRDLAKKLSDDDAQKLLDAGLEGEPEGLSAEAEALGDQMESCISEG